MNWYICAVLLKRLAFNCGDVWCASKTHYISHTNTLNPQFVRPSNTKQTQDCILTW